MTGPPADLLELYLLGELPPDEAAAVEAWLAEDAGAPAALDEARRQLARLDAVLRPPDGADELAGRIIAACPVGPGRGRAVRPWISGLAAAAAILVAVGLWLFNRPEPPPTSTD